jgi:hypothetical protein
MEKKGMSGWWVSNLANTSLRGRFLGYAVPKTTFVPVVIAWLLRTKDVVYFRYSEPKNQAISGELVWGGTLRL